MDAAGPQRGHHMPIDKQSPGRHKASRKEMDGRWVKTMVPQQQEGILCPSVTQKQQNYCRSFMKEQKEKQGTCFEPQGQEQGIYLSGT